jgi:2-polyprenyl-6-methoxyphenol hydroxylase-like FAD-dependent oxidoreductase
MAFLFLPHTHGDVDAVEGRIERLKKSFADLSAITPSLFEGVKDEDIIVGDLADIHCNMWYTKHSVLIGDAAHCLGPHAGMGSSLAFEDAYVLAGELLRVEEGKTTLGRALRRYERKQSFRVSLVKHLTMKVRLGTTQRNPLLRRLILWGLRVVPLTVLFTDLNRLFRREM